MNICFFCRGFSTNGGIGRVTSIVANELATYPNLHVFLCSYSDEKADSNYYISERCKHEFLFESPVSMTKAILQKNAIGRLCRYIHNNQINVIIACGVMYYSLAVMAARICHIKVICWEHTDPNNKRDYRFQDQNRSFGARHSDCNVVLTKSALEIYQRRFPASKTIQIYNPVDPILLQNRPQYDCESRRIISVGRLRPQKNFDRLLDIASRVIPKWPDWSWDIFGEGELHQHLVSKCEELGLSNNIFFKGQVGDLYERYKEYAFIVMTSDYEGFPMTLLEGASNNLPMVAFDVPTGPDEIIENGRNGYLCNFSSNEEMETAIRNLIQDLELRKTMSTFSRRTSENFGVKSICNRWLELFEALS